MIEKGRSFELWFVQFLFFEDDLLIFLYFRFFIVIGNNSLFFVADNGSFIASFRYLGFFLFAWRPRRLVILITIVFITFFLLLRLIILANCDQVIIALFIGSFDVFNWRKRLHCLGQIISSTSYPNKLILHSFNAFKHFFSLQGIS